MSAASQSEMGLKETLAEIERLEAHNDELLRAIKSAEARVAIYSRATMSLAEIVATLWRNGQ
jgi:hypothetical protein